MRGLIVRWANEEDEEQRASVRARRKGRAEERGASLSRLGAIPTKCLPLRHAETLRGGETALEVAERILVATLFQVGEADVVQRPCLAGLVAQLLVDLQGIAVVVRSPSILTVSRRCYRCLMKVAQVLLLRSARAQPH